MILVTSAAGNTGRVMVKKLVEAGLDVLAADINPKVNELPGIKKAMVGDLTDLSYIDALMEEATMVVHIPPLFSAQEALIGQRVDRSADDRQGDPAQDSAFCLHFSDPSDPHQLAAAYGKTRCRRIFDLQRHGKTMLVYDPAADALYAQLQSEDGRRDRRVSDLLRRGQ